MLSQDQQCSTREEAHGKLIKDMAHHNLEGWNSRHNELDQQPIDAGNNISNDGGDEP